MFLVAVLQQIMGSFLSGGVFFFFFWYSQINMPTTHKFSAVPFVASASQVFYDRGQQPVASLVSKDLGPIPEPSMLARCWLRNSGS